jgi:hypothetical protein
LTGLASWPVRLATSEVHGWLALGRLAVRPLRRGARADEFAYGADLQLPLVGILLICVVEIPPTALLLSIFVPTRAILGLVTGAEGYALWWVAALGASVITQPHRIRRQRLELRSGMLGGADVPLALIESVDVVRANLASRRLLGPVLDGGRVVMPVQGETRVEVTLTAPVDVWRLLGSPLPALVVRFQANDPEALAARLRDLLPAPRETATAG